MWMPVDDLTSARLAITRTAADRSTVRFQCSLLQCPRLPGGRLAIVASLLTGATPTVADGLVASLPWHTIDGGGAMHVAGGVYSLSFTIGQPDAAPRRVHGVHSLAPGFWGAACDLQWCIGDLNLDGVVDGQDLGVLLTDWGSAGPADLDGSGVIDGPDLGLLLSSWGPCF